MLFLFFKGRCHGNQLKSKNRRFPGPIYFVVLPFGNGLQYRNSDFKRFNEFLYIVYNFGGIRSRNLRVYAVNNSTFCGDTAKIGISRKIKKYLIISWTYLDLLYRFGKCISWDDFQNIRLAVAQGTLLWQPVKFRGWSQISPGMTFIPHFSVRQWIGRS